MTNRPHDTAIPEIPDAVAAPKGRWYLHLVWLVPIIAALIGGWLAFKAIWDQGPTITITFRAAEGLEANKTKIKYKDVDIGEVKQVMISEDLTQVIVTAEMSKRFSPYLRDDTRFWIVRPRIAFGQVSGIGTLFSGAYIGLDVGSSAEARRDFQGLEAPPVFTGDVAGRQFIIKGPDQGSIDVGTSVYLRRVPVGRVLAANLDQDGAGVTLTVFVEAPYDRFVTENTRFWNASGVDVTLDSTGFMVQTQSLATIVLGGIAFETPDGTVAMEEAKEHTIFRLFENRAQAMKAPDKQAIRFAASFTESLRGLTVGSPVEFHGISVGEITSIGAEYDAHTQTYHFPVEFSLHPDRLARHFKNNLMREEDTGLTTKDKINALVEHGLRAQLNTGSFLTGQLFVALDFFPDVEKAAADWTRDPPELPTIPGGLSGIERNLSNLAKKLDKVPFDAIATDVRHTLLSMRTALQRTEHLVQRVDEQLLPTALATIAESKQALQSVERLTASNSPLQQDAREAMRQLGRASQSLQTLADYLDRHPEALIRGRKDDNP
ncbi:PqiB family protein [Nitrospira moscoviensis]|nr:PqiB family protein [Nitrospira moscoviensis]